MRYAKRLPDGWDRVLSREVVDEFYAQLKVLYARRNPLADMIEHDNYDVPAEHKRSYFLRVLRNLKPGVTELVVHCCDTRTGDWAPPDAPRRQADTDVCCSPEFAHEIDALGIQIIDWNDFARLAAVE